MRERKRIGLREVRNLSLDQTIWDAAVPAFGARRQKGTAVSYILFYRTREGRQRWHTIGRHGAPWTPEMAREEAKRLLGEVVKGADPSEKAKADVTLGGVIEEYLEARAGLRPNTIRMNRYYLRKVWAPLHKLPIGNISRADISSMVRKITQDHGAGSATRGRATLSAVFTWAMKEGYQIEQNTVVYTNTPDPTPSRDRVLSNEELADIWKVSEDSNYGTIVRLLICTGTRRQEVGSMRWSEIKDGVWTIPGSRTKNKRQHTIPILGLAEEIVTSVPKVVDRDFLFGVGPSGFRNWGPGGEALRKRLDITPHWTLHDIRRTVATRMADIGIEPHIIEACLNHQSGNRAGVAGIYNRSRYEAGIRAAFERWDAELRAILGGEQKVVPMRRASPSPYEPR